MEKFIFILQSIDWPFALVVLIGGRYFGRNYFQICKKESLNFLGFATAFGIVWLFIKFFIEELHKNQAANLFLTYLFVTSFYQILGQAIFELIEKWVKAWLPKKDQL